MRETSSTGNPSTVSSERSGQNYCHFCKQTQQCCAKIKMNAEWIYRNFSKSMLFVEVYSKCVCMCVRVCVCVCVCEIVCISFPGGITEIPSHLIYEEIICCHMVTLDLYKLQLWLVEGLWIFIWWKNETCLQISVYFYALNSSDRKLCDSEEKHC